VPGTTCAVLPAANVWHLDVSRLPKHPKSRMWKHSAHAGSMNLHPDFAPRATASRTTWSTRRTST
jgi:hypothetical protein